MGRSGVRSAYYLDRTDAAGLESYLRARGWLSPGEPLTSIERAGEGNMNCTLRVSTPLRSVILKQSRPWVEKYPQIAAPEDRALIELAFYELVAREPGLRDRMPALVGADRASRLLMLEDLGPARDFTDMYTGGALSDEALDELVDYLGTLHGAFAGAPERTAFANREMRALNHHHIFVFPLADNGLDLDAVTPGLSGAVRRMRADADYAKGVARLGDVYLADGGVLVHGDFFPGSWLRAAGGVRVIDPEFCFFGAPEIDVGNLAAHLLFAGQPSPRLRNALARYRAARPLDVPLAGGFAGVELMRRLIGVAQLPLALDLDRKQRLLELSRELVAGRATIDGLTA